MKLTSDRTCSTVFNVKPIYSHLGSATTVFAAYLPKTSRVSTLLAAVSFFGGRHTYSGYLCQRLISLELFTWGSCVND